MFRVLMPVVVKGAIGETILFAILQIHSSNLFFETRSGVFTYGTNLDPLLINSDNSAGIGSLVKLKTHSECMQLAMCDRSSRE